MKPLIDKGVRIIQPESTWIDHSVQVDRISESAVIYPGCRITGADTSIGPGCVIGQEAPATVDNCRLGADVALKGGLFSNSVFMDGVKIGSSAHIRPYCLLEENASCGHAVGLKHTLLFPFVTLGSMINFCDCLMAGGTGKDNHSEVGSSFVHFNFSPRRHKATPSIFGDVPRGVLTNQPAIFLGGQGGAVGPISVEYGTLTAAGTVLRRSVTEPGKLACGSASPRMRQHSFNPDAFGDIAPSVESNVRYIANLHALREWYRHIRGKYDKSPHHSLCRTGAIDCISAMIRERVERLGQFADRVAECSATNQSKHAIHQRFVKQYAANASMLGPEKAYEGDHALRDTFEKNLPDGGHYLTSIKSLDSALGIRGTNWLTSVVDSVAEAWQS